MGSEHYCLRWNNHQSNLLGVFSQLLESESLVDVTLACTEGPSIRAHKVVLSACSSYFQALFLDHPNRHPIVILKDVRFAELRTLVDFMYKGEVNVEYCQLSALLKTAESLKVKGLADMTNINAAALQSTSSHSTNPIKEESSSSSSPPPPPTPSSGITLPITTILAPPPPPHSNASPPTSSATHNATSNSTAAANSNNNNNNSNNNNNNSGNNPSTTSNSNNSSTSASSHKSQQEARIDNPSRPPSSNDRHAAKDSSSHSNSHRERNSDRDRDRDCRERDRDRDRDKLDRDKRSRSRSRDRKHHHHHRHHQRHSDRHQQQAHQLQNDAIMIKSDVEDTESNECPSSPGDMATIAATTTATTTTTTRRPAASTSPCPGPLALDRPRSRRDSDSASLEETRGSLSPQSVHSGPSDMSLSNNTGGGGPAGAGGGGTVTPVTLPMSSLPQSRLPSPHSTEPLAGPSGLPPVQQVPLSLKKEVDWDRTEERSASSELSSDYRLPPDPELMGMDERVFACMYCGASFLHQSKLTRHILSHSLESLKYREQAAHLQLQAQQLGLEPSAAAAVTAGHLHLAAAAAAAEAGHYPAGVAAAAAAAVAASTGQPGGPLGPIEPMDLELASAVHSSSEPGSGVVLCKFCGKSFPDVGSLISHLPAHTGDRPFKCEFCGKAFKLRHHMKDHCRVHTGERPFRCSLCGKTFSRSTILKAHEKTHYPKYVRKFLSPSPVEPAEEESPTATGPNANATGNPPATNHPHSHH